MPKFRKKPVVIEAVQYTHTSLNECLAFCRSSARSRHCDDFALVITTLEGEMLVSMGDWIIKGVNGEFYPCKPDIFEKTYEPVEGAGDVQA